MGVQIVPAHLLHIGLLHQPAHLVGKVLPGALLRYCHMPPARQGFTGHEQIAGSFPAVLVTRLGRQWFPDFTLIEADQMGVLGFGVLSMSKPWGCTTPASAKPIQAQPHRLMGQGLHYQFHHPVRQQAQVPPLVSLRRIGAGQGYRRSASGTSVLQLGVKQHRSAIWATRGAVHPSSVFSRMRARAVMRAELFPARTRRSMRSSRVSRTA